MQEQAARKGYLILENGRIFQGYYFGKEAEAMGELVFTTCHDRLFRDPYRPKLLRPVGNPDLSPHRQLRLLYLRILKAPVPF